MKKELSSLEIAKKLKLVETDLGGVLNFSDLWNLIGLSSSERTAKIVKKLIREGVIFKIRRDIYTTQNPDPWVLASRFKENACISLDSVLAKNGLIGTVPTRSVSLVYHGNTQTIETLFGRFRYFKIKKDLIFGTQKIKGGVTIADSEKAFIDLLYYHVKGNKFSIDPLTDIDLWKLDRAKIKKYLLAYKNPNFVKFVEGVLDENP